MAGYFNLGEAKVRPGAYFTVQNAGDRISVGAVDGIVAILFKATRGPLGVVQVLDAVDGYEKTYGTGGTTDALREAFYGGAKKIIACRVGTGGTCAAYELTAATGKVKVTAKYPGTASYSVVVRSKLGDSSKKEIVFYIDSVEVEKYEFAATGDEVAACLAATANAENFTTTGVSSAAGVITNVTTPTALTGGADPTVASAQYSAGLTQIEKYYFNTICVDTTDTDVNALVAAFLNRIYQEGMFGIGVLVTAQTDSLATRMAAAAAFNAWNIVYPINASGKAGATTLSDYQVAAFLAGLIAATPSSRSITHTVLSRYTEIGEAMTNSQIEAAEQSGCLVLSTSSAGAVWCDNAITTLITPDADHDSGWKKIRRVKTRFELMYRANSVAEQLVGKVNNDKNGRATIITNIQAVCNDMVNEGKLQYAKVTESTKIEATGDTCGFDINVIDKDSAEHIYLIYYFQFSTNVE